MAFASSHHVNASHGIFNDVSGVQNNYNSYRISNPSDPLKSDVSYLPMPCHNKLFTGRGIHLQTLRQYFSPRDKCCPSRNFLVHGMGGAGKTQICLRFVEEAEMLFWRIFWVDATTVETMELSLRNIATDPDAVEVKVERSAEAVLQWLSIVKHDWLLVFDNVINGDDVAKYMPKRNRGNILFTSRNPRVARFVSASDCIEVNEMEEEDAISLLLRSSRIDELSTQARRTARPIVNELFCLPLAVDQAGAAIASDLCGIDDYLSMYRQHRQKMLADATFKGASGYGCAVYGTWDLSFTTIKKMGTPEAECAIFILQMFAFFHHENIAEETIKRAAEVSNRKASVSPRFLQLLQLDQSGSWDAFYFREGIRVLLSFSLIKRARISGLFSLHPLVHCWSRDRMSDEERQTSSSLAFAVISSSIEHHFTSQDFAYRRSLIPHINVVKLKDQISYDVEGSSAFALVFYEAGHWKEAEELYIQVIEARKKTLGEEHPQTLATMGNLASTYWNQGRWKEAEELGTQVMETRKRVLGEEHPHTLKSIHDIAVTYWNQGRRRESEELWIRVTGSMSRVLGGEHSDTLASMNNLAVTYGDQGRWKEAEELGIKVMETRKRVLGEDHPDTLASMLLLALTFKKQGRQKEAEVVELRVVERRKRVLGEEHPDTLASMNNLAVTYGDQGQWKEAEVLGIQVMEIRKKVLGEEHLDTLTSIANLASTYADQGRWKEAAELGIQAMESRKRTLGEDHPDTLASMHDIALAYLSQGQWKKAEELGIQVIEMRKRVLGGEHPDTLTSMGNLASMYADRGRWKEAEELGVKVMETRKRVLGEEHPRTLASMDNLAAMYADQGRWAEAEALEAGAIVTRKKVFGEEHPDTLKSMVNLAGTYGDQGRWEEAETLEVQVTETRKRVLGEDHPDTLISMNSLEATRDQGRRKRMRR